MAEREKTRGQAGLDKFRRMTQGLQDKVAGRRKEPTGKKKPGLRARIQSRITNPTSMKKARAAVNKPGVNKAFDEALRNKASPGGIRGSRASAIPRSAVTPASTSLAVPSRALAGQEGGARAPNLSKLKAPPAAAKAAGRFAGLVGGVSRFAGPAGIAAAAVHPTAAGNAEDTEAGSGGVLARDRSAVQNNFFQKPAPGEDLGDESQEGAAAFLAAPDNPASPSDVEGAFKEKQELAAGGEIGLRGRGELPARGQGFIQNERTGAVTEFGQGDPLGKRLEPRQQGGPNREGSSTATTSSEGLRSRTSGRRKTGNPFADIAFGFGDATRAAIAEGRGQADRARSQRLNEAAIAGLPAMQKEARLAEKARSDKITADNQEFEDFRTRLDDAPNDESKMALRREAISGLISNGIDSGAGRFAVGKLFDAMGTASGNRSAIFSERGVLDFMKGLGQGFPNEEFVTASGISISNDGDIMQDMGGGNHAVVLGMDELDDASRETAAAVFPSTPGG